MGRTVVNALHKRLISIFSKTAAEASNSQIRSMVVPKSIYIVTENDVIGYFRSAANRIITPLFNHFCRHGWICVVTHQTTTGTYLSATTVALICVVAFRTAPPIGGLSCFNISEATFRAVIAIVSGSDERADRQRKRFSNQLNNPKTVRYQLYLSVGS